ncbi:MAG: hypothetical protein ABJC10_11610 [Acidobacteriota bacterium]
MRHSIVTFLVLVFICQLSGDAAKAQETSSLQTGVSLERTLAPGQSQSFTINLEKDQFVQLVVDQHGIDVVVRAFSPEGKSLGEFDSPNGTEGVENVSFVSDVAGSYRIEVAPLRADAAAGRYEIRVLELRAATDQEVQAARNQELLKARGLALLAEVAESLPQLRLVQTRVRAQLQTAQLLWPTNEKLATKLVGDAIEGVREFLASVEVSDQDYYQTYSQAMQLREEVLQVLGPHDPEMALAFLRSTRTLANPEGEGGRWDRELQMELSLASQIISRDPKTAVRMAHESLKRGYSPNLIEIIGRLRLTEPELAALLAKELAGRLMGEKLLKTQGASEVALGLLRVAHAPGGRFQSPGGTLTPKTDTPLLSEQEYKDLFEKTLAETLSYSASSGNQNSQEGSSARNILGYLKSAMGQEMTAYAPGSVAAVEKKMSEFNTVGDPPSNQWQKYQASINVESVDSGIEEVGRAPREMRDSLYQLVAQKVASTGDIARARQILKEKISNPSQRQQSLFNLDQQSIYVDASKGKLDEALQAVNNLRTTQQRAIVISQIVRWIGPGQKRAKALEMLEQARNLLGISSRVESQEQMAALLEIARAFSRYDSKRAFELVEPLLDQFNQMSAAAAVLDGFGQQFYQDGELQMQNGSSMANFAVQLAQVLGTLATTNFDRAKTDADRLERPEVRIVTYVSIAQQAMGPGESRRARDNVRRVTTTTTIRQ